MNPWHGRLAVRALRRGGHVLHATEGVWGLACDPWNPLAAERLLALKRRSGAFSSTCFCWLALGIVKPPDFRTRKASATWRGDTSSVSATSASTWPPDREPGGKLPLPKGL